CKECNATYNTQDYGWCKLCNSKHILNNFNKLSSGDSDIDKFLQTTQLNTDSLERIIEWIPYDRLQDIKYIDKGGFGT
ncbi:7835_t:CDS:1, partial [Racocetra persica]